MGLPYGSALRADTLTFGAYLRPGTYQDVWPFSLPECGEHPEISWQPTGGPAKRTSYEANPNDARWDTFSLIPRPDFDYKSEIYRDYFAPIFRRGSEAFETIPGSFGICACGVPAALRP